MNVAEEYGRKIKTLILHTVYQAATNLNNSYLVSILITRYCYLALG
jgi:hypothetical protein